MRISIITTFYHGNKYIDAYLDMIQKVSKSFPDLEIVLVNDSPDEKLKYRGEQIKNLKLKVIENRQNMGIHAARVRGLKEAIGEYVIFLDQDDSITENSLSSQYRLAKKTEAEIILGNGLVQCADGAKKIYGNNFSQRFATKKKHYLLIRDFIISPGHVLIKRKAIPMGWQNNIMNKNGCDDYLLWLLCFNNGLRMVCNYENIYIHRYTGENYSGDDSKMYASQIEMLKVLDAVPEYNKKDLKRVSRMIHYKHNYKIHFWKSTVENIWLFLYNCYYRIVWRGYKRDVFGKE